MAPVISGVASEVLQSCKLFAGLAPSWFEFLASQSDTLALDEGEYFYRQSESGDRLYVLVEGSIELVSTVGQADVVLRRIQRPGQFLGEQVINAQGDGRLAVDARASEPTVLLIVDRETYTKATRCLPEAVEPGRVSRGKARLRQELAMKSLLVRELAVHDEPEFSVELEIPAGEAVFRQGDRPNWIYVIHQGSARVLWSDAQGRERSLVELKEGQAFGVRSVLGGHPRTATVQADEPLRLVAFDGERFAEALSQSDALYPYMRALRQVQARSGEPVFQFDGEHQGHACIITLELGRQGETVLSRHAVDAERFHSVRQGVAQRADVLELVFDDPRRSIRRRLGVQGQALVEIDARGPWKELGSAYHLLGEGTPLSPEALKDFEETGSLFEGPSEAPKPCDVVCFCLNLTRADITSHLKRGCGSVQQLRERCGASGECGGCVGTLAEMTGSLGASMRLTERTRLADNVWAFRFAPLASAALTPSLPGQHVALSASIDGETVTRSYTLTSADTTTSYREITVKREPHGHFSRWLFDAPDGQVVEMSPPQGRFHMEPGGSETIVCLVAGIGVTPALAIARSSSAFSQSVFIDYSVPFRRDAVALSELERLSSSPNCGFNLRLTSQGDRLTPETIGELAAENAGAQFFICGPENFQDMATSALSACGVPDEKVRTEVFEIVRSTPEAQPPVRTSTEWFGSALSVVGVVAYLLQSSLGWQPELLIALQSQFNYQLGSGLLLAAFLLFQWWLPSQRLLGDSQRALRAVDLHRKLGWFAPLVFAAHSLNPGYGMVLILSTVYLANILVGVFDKTIWRSPENQRRHHRVWLAVHVLLSILTLSLGAFHAYTALAFKGGV